MANPRLLNGVSSPQSVFEASSVQHHRLGSKGELDNRIFYYAKNAGAALTVSALMVRAAEADNHVGAVWASGGAANSDTVVVTLGATSAAANLYRDGWFAVVDGTGQGQLRQIRAHTSGSSSGTVSVTVYDPFTVSISTSAETALLKNRYDSVIVSPGDAVDDVVGVPQVGIGAGSTTPQYFWIQTWGPALVVGDGSTFADGSMVTQATATTDDAGQITLVAGTASNASVVPTFVLGSIIDAVSAASDGDARFVNLRIQA